MVSVMKWNTLHTDQIVSQHTSMIDRMVGLQLQARGLWDGGETTKERAAEAVRGRVVLEEHRDPNVTLIKIDGARVCSIATSVEFIAGGGIAAITRVGP